MAVQVRDMDLLWKEYFRDPSQWWDHRDIKSNPKFPDFKHKTKKESLWINDWYNPSWVETEFAKRVQQRQATNEDCWVSKENQNHLKTQEREDLEVVSNLNHQILQEHTAALQKDIAAVVGLLKACAQQKDLCKGSRIHADIRRTGLLETNLHVGTLLVNMYAKCGALVKAQEVFDELPVRDLVSWNALITGYAQHGQGHEALTCFERMQNQGFCPDAVTFTCVLKACGSIGAAHKGEEIHAEVVRQGLLENNTILGTALVDMYGKCGELAKAKEVFNELAGPSVVSWNALIAGYAQHGQGQEALNCYERMQGEGLSPNVVTFNCILKACGSVGAAAKGEKIHAEIVRQGLLGNDTILGTSLTDMYAKCGALAKAQGVFNELPSWDIVSWNALIAGYAQHGHGREALKCFEWMHYEGFVPNAVTYICILKACSSVGAVEKGEEFHAQVARQGLLEKDTTLGTVLVDMYAKCGALAKAQEVFDELPVKNVISWSALIAGYAHLGKVEKVFNSFNKMIREGIQPDPVIFIVLLKACSHSGLVDEGQMYFGAMTTSYGIIPTLEHHTCMVDLFGRAGHLDKAMRMIEKMPPSKSSNYHPLWAALLGSCRKWGNVKLGKLAFEHVVQLDEKDAAAYVCMGNIYAAASMRDEANKVEAMRVRNKAWKMSGCSRWTDVGGNAHSFIVGNTSHPQSESIYKKLNEIGQKITHEGYSCRSLQQVSDHIVGDARKDVLCGHSEKLAIACALINTPEETPIHVTKNMQVCGDCHLAVSLISKIEKRKIVVRDANLFHIFEDGKCSCAGYW